MKLNEFTFRQARKRQYDPKEDPKVKELLSQYRSGLITHDELKLGLEKFGLTHYEINRHTR